VGHSLAHGIYSVTCVILHLSSPRLPSVRRASHQRSNPRRAGGRAQWGMAGVCAPHELLMR